MAYQIPPIGGPAVQRHLRFLSRLPECGWAPFVLTVNPADCEDYYPRDETLSSLLPAGVSVFRARSFNPMERLLAIKSSISSMLDVSAGQSNAHAKRQSNFSGECNGVISKTKDLVTEMFRIPDRQIGWYPFATRKGLEVVKNEGIDVIYSSGNPWTAHLVGRYLAKKCDLPWVADFRDPWTLNPYKNKRFRFIEAIEERLERAVVERATYVVANTKPLKEKFFKAYPYVPKSKVVHIGNGYNGKLFQELGSSIKDKRFVLAHIGSLYANRSPLSILESVARLKSDGVISKENFVLRFVGTVSVPGVDYDLTVNMDIDDIVQFCPPVSHSRALLELASSDVLLIIQPATKLQIPAKIFEYIAVGKPIFAITGEGATADLIRDECLGVVANPNETGDIMQKLIALVKLHSEESLPVIPIETRGKFESLPLTQQLAQLFENCIERKIDK